MRFYYRKELSDDDVREQYPDLMNREAGYSPESVRSTLLKQKSSFVDESIISIEWLPFDTRFFYWEPNSNLIHRKRSEFKEQVREGNFFLACTQKPRKGPSSPPMITAHIGSYYVFDPYTTYFPALLSRSDLLGQRDEPNINPDILSPLCQAAGISVRTNDGHTSAAALERAAVFYHALAVLWSPAYRTENEAALRQDWPRVPIPADPAVLDASAKLGRTVADLLLPDQPVPGVTTGKLRPELRTLGVPSKVGGGTIDPADLKVEAGYGFRGQKNAVMCGKGKAVPRPDDPSGALDVYINDRVYWANVPADVWAMTIGGYPVLKKWLSYREFKVLGRPLRGEEVTYVTEVIRRLKALLPLGADLDANDRACSAHTLTLPAAAPAPK
jgi:hypothetical protein